MLTSVYAKNFQGMTFRYSLGNLTIINGDNGAGKTTVIKAIQLLLLGTVPSDSVNNIEGDRFKYYCGHDAGEMEISVTTENGTVLKRWKKHKGEVTTQTEFNGAKTPARFDAQTALGIKLFNVEDFWQLTPSNQINAICLLAGIDPVELGDLNEKLEQVNTEKREEKSKLDAARKALEDHDIEIQLLVEAGRVDHKVNLAEVNSEIKSIEAEVANIDKEIFAAIESEAIRKRDTERLKTVSGRVAEIGSEMELIVIPSEAIDITVLEAEKAKFESVRLAFNNVESIRKTVARLSAKSKPEPMQDISPIVNDLQAKIANAEAGRGIAPEKKIKLEAFKEFYGCLVRWEKDEALDLSILKAKFKEYAAPLIEEVKASENVTPLETVSAWKGEIAKLNAEAQAHAIRMHEYKASQRELEDLKGQLLVLGNITWDQQAYDQILNDIAARKLGMQEAKNNSDRKNKLREESTKLSREIISLDERLTKELKQVDIVGLKADKETKQEKYKILRGQVEGLAKYNNLYEIREKKLVQIERLSASVKFLSSKEDLLQNKKLAMLEKVQGKISESCNKITTPAQIEIEIPNITKKNKSEKIKFYYKKPNGDKVEQCTLSGAQTTEFNIALGYALSGSSGVVIAEIDSMDIVNKDKLVNKINNLSEGFGIQTILVGHSLSRFENHESALNYICVK